MLAILTSHHAVATLLYWYINAVQYYELYT